MTNDSRRHTSFLDLIWRYKGSLIFYIIGVSFLTFVGLYLLGGVPDELKSEPGNDVMSATDTRPAVSTAPDNQDPINKQITISGTSDTQIGELPTHVVIDKIGVNVEVRNPASADEKTLDEALLHGAIHYPGSGTLGHGNMFLLAHSTGIKIVNNQAYKAFNNLKNLNLGDVIRVRSATREYTYKVTSVELDNSDTAFINLTTTKNMITLTTCNVFGEKQERFIVQGIFSGSTPL